MQTGKISVQTENIFPIIKKFLYSDHEIFLRELISNAIDATSKLKILASKGVYKEELGDLTIDVILDEENKTLTVRDRGIGMNAAEVEKYLNQVAFSSAEAFLKKYKDESGIIGHFGLGFYSAFMVADKVEVTSRSYKHKTKGVKWVCKGTPEYSIEDIRQERRGTDVTLHINEDSKEFLERDRIESILKKYCRFLPVEIRFGTRTETSWEGEGEDRKEIKEEVDNIVNNTSPIWKKPPADLEDENYKSFYRDLYPLSPEPMFWVHLNIDYPFNLTGVLYFPQLGNSFEIQKDKIQLYSNQVFITDDVKEIVPEFLMLLHGVIDSPDIPLNVSRSYLQSDHNVKKISSYISKKVAEKLNDLFKKDRSGYEEKWDNIGVFVKYGMISDEKFHERAEKFALLKNVDGKYFTLEEYREKVKDAQTDKHDKIVLLYSSEDDAQVSYVEAAKTKGYDVLLCDQVIDNHFMQHLEYKLKDVTFVRVDSDTVDNLVQKDESQESVLSENEEGKIKELFEEALPLENTQITMRALSPEDDPIVITKPEFLRRMKEMQMLQGMKGNSMPESFNVVVNTNHPLIATKLLRMRSPEKKKDFAHYLYNLAQLNQDMLKGKDLTTFVKRSIEFLK